MNTELNEMTLSEGILKYVPKSFWKTAMERWVWADLHIWVGMSDTDRKAFLASDYISCADFAKKDEVVRLGLRRNEWDTIIAALGDGELADRIHQMVEAGEGSASDGASSAMMNGVDMELGDGYEDWMTEKDKELTRKRNGRDMRGMPMEMRFDEWIHNA